MLIWPLCILIWTIRLIWLSELTGSILTCLLLIWIQSQSESELLYNWRFTTYQFILATSPLRLTTRNFFFQLNTCSHSPYVTSSLMRGWVCWPSPAQSFSGPSPAGLTITFYCLRFKIPPTWRARSPYLYTPGTAWPSYNPTHWVPFSSPPTTRRAMVEVSDPVSTWEHPDLWLNSVLLLYTSGWTDKKHLFLPVSKEMPVYPTAMGWFPRIYLHGKVFCLLFPSNGSISFTRHYFTNFITIITTFYNFNSNFF
jgi:hypothetical protein